MMFQHQSQFLAFVLLNVILNSFAQGEVTSTPDFYEKYSVRPDEPVDKTKSYDGGMDDERKAFWIVLYMTMLMLVLLVSVTIFWQRHRLIELYQRKVGLWEGKVDLETKEPLQGPNNAITVVGRVGLQLKEAEASSLIILLMISAMTIMVHFQIPLIMCLVLLGVTWADSVRGDVALAEDIHKSILNCTKNQYYDEHLEICSPCKEVCPTIPCPICPHFVVNPEPVLETKPEQHDTVDNARRAFWIVLGIIIVFIVCIVGYTMVCLRHRLISLCKKKTKPRVVEAKMETQQPLCGQNSTLVV